jgi:type I restriction enzyme S subunit
MSWKECQLGDVIELRYGKSLPDRDRKQGDVPVYGSGGIGGFHNVALVSGPGVIVGRKGSVGSVFYEPRNFYPIDTTYYVAPKADLDLRYAFYLLSNLPLASMNSDVAVPGLNRDRALGLNIKIPSMAIQKTIVKILSTYDDLIDNNRRRMALLEDSARQLYREWFVRLRFPGHEHTPVVDGVPQGWVRLPATEALKINPKIKLSDAEVHWFVEMANLPTDSMVIEGAYLREGRSGPKFQNGDTLFARITPCLENGKTGFVDFMDEGEAGRGSTEFIVLRSKRVTPEFVYCLSRTYEFRGNAIKSMIGSSGRQRVQESCFEKFMVNVPPTSLLRLFSDFAEPAFEEIKNLASQNQKLRQARDLLLPRLMNGELAV